MASVGKAKRKVKGKTVDLNSFLGDQNAPSGFTVVTPRRDWADYVEEETNDDKYSNYKKEEKGGKLVLPTAPKAARGPNVDVAKIPSEPPFTAYVGNLPYDVTEEEITRFFGNLKVLSVRLPRDGGDRGRMRGFGYAEFESKQALIEALSLNGETVKNRPVKVSLAGESEGDRSDRKSDGIDRTAGDWRALSKGDDQTFSRNTLNNRYDNSDVHRIRNDQDDKGRLDETKMGYQGRRNNDKERDYGLSSDRERTYKKYSEGFNSNDRNRGSDSRDDEWRRDDKRENYEPWKDNKRDIELRRDDRRDTSDSKRNDRKSNYEFRRDDRRDFEFKRNTRNDDPGFGHDDNKEHDRPKERTRLNLKPRSVPVDQSQMSSSSSIFGGAKPVDTAAKEREIEKRLAKEKGGLGDVNSLKISSDKNVKKGDSNYINETLAEKNGAVGNIEISSNDNTGDCTYSINGTHHVSNKEANGVIESFLANKFAHLAVQED